ncbi:MAG: hypothetical protein KKA19_06090, partial [Candidatus Margulisbacteria bacterium]|nr:hypothetical protein [Candidatus Margulisiibacteriota bacterium]
MLLKGNNKLLLICLGLALAVSLAIGLNRVFLEIRNIKVETVIGFREVQKLKFYSGATYAQVFAELKNAGITSIAVEEDTLNTLKAAGEISWYKGEQLINLSRIGQIQNYVLANNARQANINPGYNYILVGSVETYNRARDSLIEELGPTNVTELGGYILEVKGNINDLGELGLGISEPIAIVVRNYGFNVIPRLVNSTRLQEEMLARKLSRVEQMEGVNTIIFSGRAVLGYNNNISLIVNQMRKNNLNFGFIEFAEQKGSLFMAKEIPAQTLGVHSISDYSLDRMNPNKAIARYVLAVAERGMRILYIRPFFNIPAGADVLKFNVDYFSKLKKTLEARHFQVATITEHVMQNIILKPNIFFMFFLALGVGASLLIFLQIFYKIQLRTQYIVLTLFFIITLIAYFSEKLLVWRSFLALIVTLIFPTYALIAYLPQKIESAKGDPWRWKLGVKLLLKMVGVVSLGSLLIIGILSDPRYMLKIYQFFGVKLAYIFPVLFVSWYYLFYPQKVRSIKFIIRRLLQIPISLGALFLAGGIALVFLLYVGRSGNYYFPVFGGEDIFRQILNTIF